jgi:hypothetical protein
MDRAGCGTDGRATGTAVLGRDGSGSGRGRVTDDVVFGAARFGSERGRGAGSNFGSGALATGSNGAGGGDTAGGVGDGDSLNRNAIRGGISGFAARGGSPRNTIDPA